MDSLTQGRLQGSKPIAVIDIGSNSIRLVVYEGLARSPTPLFQEKVMCGLGRNLSSSRRLNKDAIPLALASLLRFRKLSDICGVKKADLHPFATAAVRWAEDGPEFLEKGREACGVPINVVGSEEEAELAATGILCGFASPAGIAGDLGGGSLELARIRGGTFENTLSLPLGTLTLLDRTKGDKAAALSIIDDALNGISWLGKKRGARFYAIGGTWRALAKLHMRQVNYPLTAIHGYRLDARKALQTTARYANISPSALSRMEGFSPGREETLPFGALLLNSIIRKIDPSEVVFSAFGIREGTIYRLLSEAERAKDPLLAACEEVARLRSRSYRHAKELIGWTDPLFQRAGLSETAEEKRLRQAACLLSDVSWRAHPDYRGEQSAAFVAQSALVGIDHPGRAFLALCVFHRYERKLSGELLPKLSELVPRQERKRALILGQAFRLAHTISAGMGGVLPQTSLSYDNGSIVLQLPQRLQGLNGEAVKRRLRFLARELGLSPEIRVAEAREPQKTSFFTSLLGDGAR
ncbi:MAG TPA: Ppx/GppA phosphatase family protein [Hyphomicrobiales bacterium]|nr:Ppx/GppA phosphatase family protein [Hyphomicrobiales bacterium]